MNEMRPMLRLRCGCNEQDVTANRSFIVVASKACQTSRLIKIDDCDGQSHGCHADILRRLVGNIRSGRHANGEHIIDADRSLDDP